MDSKELQELLKLVNRLELAEFKYKQGDVELSVRTKFYNKFGSAYYPEPTIAPSSQPAQPLNIAQTTAPHATSPKASASDAETAATSPGAAAPKENLIEIRSPIVGTFYRSPSPDKPVYVKPGDMIGVGTVVCIVEAMKLFNEIESEVAGKVVKILVEDATPVEYDQLLFLIDPNG